MKFWDDPAFNYARAITARHSKSFYISAGFLPKEKRWATYGLYGFCRYADNLIDNPRGRSPYDILEEIESLAREIEIAYRTGESEHPIVRVLITVAKRYGIPMQYPLELLAGVRMDLENKRYETFDDLYLFCYRVAAVVGLMMTYVMGYTDVRAFTYAEKLGVAMQLTNILRDIKEDALMGRIYIPQAEIRRFRCHESDIARGYMTNRFRELMEFQADRAKTYYLEADYGIPMLTNNCQFAIRSASRIYRGILAEIESRNFNPFLGRVHVSQRRKIGILFSEIIRGKLLPSSGRWLEIPETSFGK